MQVHLLDREVHTLWPWDADTMVLHTPPFLAPLGVRNDHGLFVVHLFGPAWQVIAHDLTEFNSAPLVERVARRRHGLVRVLNSGAYIERDPQAPQGALTFRCNLKVGEVRLEFSCSVPSELCDDELQPKAGFLPHVQERLGNKFSYLRQTVVTGHPNMELVQQMLFANTVSCAQLIQPQVVEDAPTVRFVQREWLRTVGEGNTVLFGEMFCEERRSRVMSFVLLQFARLLAERVKNCPKLETIMKN